MAGICLTKLPHSCGTRDGLQVFERKDDDTVDGWCFSCGTYVRNPFGEERKLSSLPKPKIKSPEEIHQEIAEMNDYPVVDVPQKKLRATSLDYFSIKTALSEQDGVTPTMLCYPYTRKGELVGYKIKTLDKKRIWSVGDIKGADFFGWEQAIASGARKLIITEGEDDAAAYYQVIQKFSKQDYKDFYAIVSLPRGVGSAVEALVKNINTIRQFFSEVLISFDMDDAGRNAVEEVCKSVSNLKVVNLPCKDANECIIKGHQKALYQALFKANRPKNTRLVLMADVVQEAMKPPTYGELSWPWQHLNKATRGIRLGHGTYIGAGTKMGKSEVVNALASHFVLTDEVKVFMAKPEESNTHTVKLIAGKVAGQMFHDPDISYEQKDFIEACAKVEQDIMMIDLYQHIGWETLKEDIIEAVEWGAKAIFIDPITNLTSGVNPSEANVLLEKIAEDIAIMAMDLNFHYFIFCHLKAHEGNISKERREKYYREEKYIGLGNCPHEMGGDVLSSQFAGSRAMQRKCQTMIGFEGNRDASLDRHLQNIRNFKILEEREFGASGVYPVFWNEKTSQFSEV